MTLALRVTLLPVRHGLGKHDNDVRVAFRGGGLAVTTWIAVLLVAVK